MKNNLSNDKIEKPDKTVSNFENFNRFSFSMK